MTTRTITRRSSRREVLHLLAVATGAAALGIPLAGAAPSMLKRRIPSSAEELPVIGLGTWQTFDVGSSADARRPLEDVLAAFTRLGGKVIDSSPMYGRSEEVAGAIADKLGVRNRLFVATKVWTSGKENGIEQMERSQQLLRTPRIDLMQVHNLVDVDTHLATLADWKRAGRIRYIGITHYSSGAYAEVARTLRRHRVDFLQINYSLAEREAERQLLPLAAERGVAVIVNRPFGGGSLFSSVRGKPLPPWAKELDCSSWAQLMLKWIVGHPAVTCAIPATEKVRHLEDNIQAGYGRLPDDAMRRRIADAIANL